MNFFLHSMGRHAIYLIILSFCFCLGNPGAWAQTSVSVSGTVSDRDGPIYGATVQVKGKSLGTSSDVEGRYTLTVSEVDTLVFSYLGYESQEFLVGTRTVFDVVLTESLSELEAVVVNAGYYTVSEKERTGSIASVTSEALERQTITDPIEALQGRMAGVQVVQSTGVPGGSFSIRIRGQNSIAAGNEPLYVIDGVPYSGESLGNSQATIAVIPSRISPLNNLNYNDIEKIEVLKDADATAIYGSRGANGVVLITTKSGKAGKLQVNFKVVQGVGEVTSKMDLLSTSQYIAMREEAYANDGVSSYPANAYDLNGTWDRNRYTDWQKALIGGQAHMTNVQGSVSGGSEQTRFLVSANYYRTTDVFPDDAYMGKGGVHSSFQHVSPDKRFELQFSADYTVSKADFLESDLTRYTLSLAPNAPELYNEDGSLNWQNGTWTNPLSYLERSYLNDQQTLVANTVLSYEVLSHVKLKSSFGYTSSHLKERKLTPYTAFNPSYALNGSSSSMFLNIGDRNSWIVEPQMSYDNQWGGHRLSMLVGSTFQKNMTSSLAQFGTGFSSNHLLGNLGAANSISMQGDTTTEYKYMAVFGRINYTYQDRYILNLTGRRDGSSRFGPGKQFANFGAIGAAWLFSSEPLLKEIPWLSFGKLRASYGTTGNDQIGDYQYLDTYQVDSGIYDGFNGLEPTRLFNPVFGWEKNTKLTAGLDIGFLQDRILTSVEYYRNRSSSQLVGIPMPYTTGFSSLQANLDAEVQNSGWEFGLHAVVFNGQGKAFRWSTDMNLSLNRNKLLAFPDLEGSTYANTLIIGQPLNIVKTYHVTGIDADTGVFTFEDYNEDGTISSAEDRQYLVDLTPKFFGGMTHSFSYQGFQLSCLFSFVKQTSRNFMGTSGVVGTLRNQSTAVLNHWPDQGSGSFMQAYTSGSNSAAQSAGSRFASSNGSYSDGSYVRLKNVELAYTLPQTWLTGVETRLFVQGQNLWTWTNYLGLDPETPANTLPPLRQWNLGVQLSF